MTTQFTYNGDGDRLAQIVAGVTTNYALDPMGLAQVLIETTGGQSTHYLPGLAQYRGNTWNYYLPDRLGSVRQMVDPTGAVLLAQSYDPFGNVLQQTGSGQNTFGYTGEQTDPTGLVFLRARYYNPAVGRFITADSVVPDPVSSQGWNRYAYGYNNPVKFTDPSGHCIVQWSGEVRMGQAPYGTSGVCPHTQTAPTEAANAATAMHNDPGSRLPFPFLTVEMRREFVRSLLPKPWHDEFNAFCAWGDQWTPYLEFGFSLVMMVEGGGPGPVFGKVPYASTNLSKLAMEFRRVNNLKTGNIAVFEYIDVAGSLQTIIRRSTRGIKGGGHAERIIGRELERMGIDPSQVTRIYSEFEPCIVPANCSRYIQETYPQAEVTYSFEYGASPASRQSGRSAPEEAIESIFNLNFFDKVD